MTIDIDAIRATDPHARTHVPALCDEIEQLRAIAARSEYRYGDQFCVEGECDHAAETDENAAEGAPCPLVETRYATADDVIELDKLRAQVAELTAALAGMHAELDKVRGQLTAANHHADGLAADLRSAQHANTAHANENAALRRQGVWEAPAEPADVTAVRDRTGQLWVCPGRPGDNLWWRDQLGRGIGYEWHQLIAALGPLTAATEAEVAR